MKISKASKIDFHDPASIDEEEDDETASRFGEALLDHVDLLSRFPRMGNTIRKPSRVRKLVHSPIYYEIIEEKRLVEVLHFRHGSRKPPRF